MAADPDKAALALHRFGFGPRAGSIAAIASDPQGALAAELDRPNAGQIVDPGLLSSAAAFRAVFEFNAARAAQAKLVRPGSEAAEPGVGPATQTADKPAAGEPRPETVPQRNFLAEAKARIGAARDAEIGFVERLVWFWSNHFCVSLDTSAMAGGYEREAIRPHVLGRFVDLLLAAESHPAMLIYLNDAQSIGPDSVAGINRGKGLNENFAREILELHTLGVRTGYTQADVISFAKALTGWTLRPPVTDPDIGGEFVFIARAHEPGAETVLGKTYPDTGLAQGRAVLTDLARHPATAKHIATKLAIHFVADDPPAALDRSPGAPLSRHRRRSQRSREGADRRTRGVAAAAGQVEAPGRMARRGVARDRARRRHPPRCPGRGAARRAAVAAAGAERFLR